MAIEEQHGAQGLVLGGGADVALFGECGQERDDVGGAEGGGVLFVVVEDVAADPAEVGLFGASTEVSETADLANLVEEAGRLRA